MAGRRAQPPRANPTLNAPAGPLVPHGAGMLLFAAIKVRLVLRAAGHVNDLAGRESDLPAQAEQKIRVVGDGGLGLRFRFDVRVAAPMAGRCAGCRTSPADIRD